MLDEQVNLTVVHIISYPIPLCIQDEEMLDHLSFVDWFVFYIAYYDPDRLP
jgi:hypothetical protein